METGIPARLSAAEGRKFGVTVGVAFLVLASLFHFWRHRETAGAFFGVLGALLIVGVACAADWTPATTGAFRAGRDSVLLSDRGMATRALVIGARVAAPRGYISSSSIRRLSASRAVRSGMS